MTKKDFAKINTLVKAAVKEGIEPINKRLDDPEFGLGALNRK